MSGKLKRRYLTDREKLIVIERQAGRCACGCREPLGTDPRLIEYDHAQDLRFGGTNDLENFRALIKKHHLQKTIDGHRQAAKIERLRQKHAPGGKLSGKKREFQKMLERRWG